MSLKNSKKYKEAMLKYDFAKKKIETELDILMEEHEFKTGYNPVEHTKSRIKTYESIVEKLESKKLDITVDNMIKYINDLVGIRIICTFLEEVYEIANIIKSSKEFIVCDDADYIKEPKASGYSSYHIDILVPVNLKEAREYVKVEIQIRTVAMDTWATFDHKLRYKLPNKIPKEVKEEMQKRAIEVMELDKRMQKINELIKKYAD